MAEIANFTGRSVVIGVPTSGRAGLMTVTCGVRGKVCGTTVDGIFLESHPEQQETLPKAAKLTFVPFNAFTAGWIMQEVDPPEVPKRRDML